MPSKSKKNQNPTSPGRRSFLSKLWFGLGLVVCVEFIWVVITFLRPRKPRALEDSFGSTITAGAVGDFERGSVTAIVRGYFYLACLEDGGFLALSRKCTHLGCTVPWDSKNNQFACPCHASVFDIKGNVISPPAPRALDIYPITIENEMIRVDTRKPIRRSAFRPEQATYAKRI